LVALAFLLVSLQELSLALEMEEWELALALKMEEWELLKSEQMLALVLALK
tara:strand:+ start:16 stop:168 length:153 start_codon:yes stop_codon:yes gene_type:complete